MDDLSPRPLRLLAPCGRSRPRMRCSLGDISEVHMTLQVRGYNCVRYWDVSGVHLQPEVYASSPLFCIERCRHTAHIVTGCGCTDSHPSCHSLRLSTLL
ncbi:hypothetical protein TNCV_2048811 [Trichonephila clavipes]|nr:hypothetical protein TNCV_2048811 [Trichonephila clavipes]